MKIPKLKNIKHEEGIVKAYLEHWGYENIVYEPIKNETPDFLINNETAIEVRRLNQHYFGVGRVSAYYPITESS